MDRDNRHRKDYKMVKILRCCDHKPNDKCDLTGVKAPYAHEYRTYKGEKTNDSEIDWRNCLSDYKPQHLGYHHNKVFTSQDALNLAISESEKLEKQLGIEITIEEDPQ